MKTILRRANTKKKVSEHDTEKKHFQNYITVVHIKKCDCVTRGKNMICKKSYHSGALIKFSALCNRNRWIGSIYQVSGSYSKICCQTSVL